MAATQAYRQLRREAGISIRTLELLTGINRGRLSIIERGVEPTPEEDARIRDAIAAHRAEAGQP